MKMFYLLGALFFGIFGVLLGALMFGVGLYGAFHQADVPMGGAVMLTGALAIRGAAAMASDCADHVNSD